MKNYFDDINDAITTMHYLYGIGDVKEIRRFADGRIEVIAQGYYMKSHVRRGRIVGGRTIKMYGHQLTISKR
jgi:hypothetical protein